MMSVAWPFTEDLPPDLKRIRVEVRLTLSFSDKNKVGTSQPHDNTLVVTLRIGGYIVKRMLVDQGNGAKIMYFDLFRGLKLRSKDLTYYDSPLIVFDGKIDSLNCQIRLPMQVGLEVVEVNFIVVYAYSPYIAIVARPWLHAMGAMFSTLYLKVKYPSEIKLRS